MAGQGGWLQRLKEEVSSPQHVYPRQVHAYSTQGRGERVPPPEVRELVCRPPEVSLFSGLPLGLCDSLYVDILQPDIVGVRLLRWEADLVFPSGLSAWVRWHAALPPPLSDEDFGPACVGWTRGPSRAAHSLWWMGGSKVR